MALFNLFVNSGRLRAPMHNNPGRGVIADRFIEFGRQLASGMLDQMTVTEDDTPVLASGTYTLSSSSGVLTATINGVAIATGSLAGTDTANAVVLAAAINASANALIAGIVTATSALGVVTVTAARGGLAGNTVTTTASGTGNTANQARLTGGTNGTSTTVVF